MIQFNWDFDKKWKLKSCNIMKSFIIRSFLNNKQKFWKVENSYMFLSVSIIVICSFKNNIIFDIDWKLKPVSNIQQQYNKRSTQVLPSEDIKRYIKELIFPQDLQRLESAALNPRQSPQSRTYTPVHCFICK
jgi:hypothetical protein